MRRFPKLPRAISPREKRMMKVTLLFLGSIAVYLYVVEPRITEWMQLEKDLGEAMAHYQKLSVLVEHEEVIRNRYARLSKSFASRGSDSADAIEFYQFLGSLDSGDALRVTDLRPVLGRGNKGDKLKKMQVVVFCEGTVDGLEDTLQRIATSDQALSVDKLSFSLLRQDSPLKITAAISKTVRRAP